MLVIRLLLVLFGIVGAKRSNEKPRIAIIGGGMAGTTAAYELTQMALEHGLDLDIDLYESGNIGGRLATSFVNGFEFETGGSIIHARNKYMNLYAERFNLGKINYTESGSDRCLSKYGFFDGKEFVYADSDYEVISMFKLWWRYGEDLLKINRHFVQPLLEEFDKIYKWQSEGITFNSVYELLDSTLRSYTRTTLKDKLLSKGFNERFIDEFVFLATNVNYNQNTSIHAFVGGVALAGAQASLWSVRGGNKRVPEELLRHSDARLIRQSVESITHTYDERFSLESGGHSILYDYAIIANPLMENAKHKITFYNFSSTIDYTVTYKQTVATLVRGVLNNRYFNYDSLAGLPNTIFSVNESLFFNSVGLLNPVKPDEDYNCNVYKVFSKDVLTKEQLDLLFLCYSDVTVIDWLAYPVYDSKKRVRDFRFTLYPNLFYTNAIEGAASAMEMSAIAGHNAALQVMDELKKSAV